MGSPIMSSRSQLWWQGWSVPGPPRGAQGWHRVPSPCPGHSHLDLVILLSVCKLEGVGLDCAGHGGPAACPGSPPLLLQALPGALSLGQHPRQLPPGIYLRVVAAAPPASSPSPAEGCVGRHAGTLSQWVGPHLSHWAQLSSYPIGEMSMRRGTYRRDGCCRVCGRVWGVCGRA